MQWGIVGTGGEADGHQHCCKIHKEETPFRQAAG
jgi:hypothetical protein